MTTDHVLLAQTNNVHVLKFSFDLNLVDDLVQILVKGRLHHHLQLVFVEIRESGVQGALKGFRVVTVKIVVQLVQALFDALILLLHLLLEDLLDEHPKVPVLQTNEQFVDKYSPEISLILINLDIWTSSNCLDLQTHLWTPCKQD